MTNNEKFTIKLTSSELGCFKIRHDLKLLQNFMKFYKKYITFLSIYI